MDNITPLAALLTLPFPIWPLVTFWLVWRVACRKTAPWVGLLAGLASAALAVGFFLVFWQWLEQPWLARVSAVIYGSPAFFLLLCAASNWWLGGSAMKQVPGSQAALGDQTSPASGADHGVS
jgi:hypothetical protein